jgi:hypothetical protein
MAMPSSSKPRRELVALAWSLWAELGVSGWERRHRKWFIDPEPLIIFTSWLGDEDARLRDEATDWCIRYGSWVSATRLANLLDGHEGARERFGELAATVARHSSIRWRGATTARPYEPTDKSRLVSFDAPSLVSLRLRALLGVGARAEIVRQCLSAAPLPRSASDFVDDAGFMKRNIADALEALRLGGALEAMRRQNKVTYRLRQQGAWHDLLGELPRIWPRWTSLLPLLARASDALDHVRTLPARSANVEITRLARELLPLAERAEVRPLPPQLDAFEGWVLDAAAKLARGGSGTRGWLAARSA